MGNLRSSFVYQSTMKAARAVPSILSGVRQFGTTPSRGALPALLPGDGKKAMRLRTWFIQGLTMQEDRANGGIDVVIAPKDLAEMKGDLASWLKFSDAEKDDKLNAWRKAGKLKFPPILAVNIGISTSQNTRKPLTSWPQQMQKAEL